jgi:hypothetical protein
MIEQFFDSPVLKIKGYEYDLVEKENLTEWFICGDCDLDNLSEKEQVLYEYLKTGELT